MKNNYSKFLTLAAAMFLSVAAPAQQINEGLTRCLSPVIEPAMPLVATAWSDQTTSCLLLVDEDFSLVTSGTTTHPDQSQMLASFYGETSPYIDSQYTHESGWTADCAYPAGGALALISRGKSVGAPLNTPMGDYSGDLRIHCRVKCMDDFDDVTQLIITPARGGIGASMTRADLGTDQPFNTLLYAGQGWMEIDYYVSNYSADADGLIQFNVYGAAIIDDIYITSTSNFIAAPHIQPATNFTPTSFTANWDKVRKAADYRVYLYQKVFLTDEEFVDYAEDFEDGAIDSDWSYTGSIQEGVGKEGSKALVMPAEGEFITPNNQAKYRNYKMWIKAEYPEGASASGMIYYECRTATGWQTMAYSMGSMAKNGMDVDLQAQSWNRFNDQFYGVKVRTTGMPEGTQIIIDDVTFTTGRPSRIEIVKADGLDYRRTKELSYTFTDLDPATEYYYKVNSHFQLMESDGEVVHAFGLAAPETLAPSDLDEAGSYVARWSPVAKASRYQVRNYGVLTSTQSDYYSILVEDFYKVNADITTSDDPSQPTSITASTLDQCTDFPGWTGSGLVATRGMIGCAATMYSVNTISTPELYLDNADSFDLFLKLVGGPNNYVTIYVEGIPYDVQLNEQGKFEGTIQMPHHGKALVIKFGDVISQSTFFIDEIEVTQYIDRGHAAYIYQGQAEVGADTTEHLFTDLQNFNTYAYSVVAIQSLDGQEVASEPSDFQRVLLREDPALAAINSISTVADTQVVARYAITGIQTGAQKRGFSIVRYADGHIQKTYTY